MGYPTYYNGRSYTWTKGKLTRVHCGAAQQPGSLYADCKFTYDAYGRRLSKSYTHDPNTASTSDYSYTYNTTYNYDNSGRLLREYCVEKYTYSGGGTNTREFIYLYDESGIIGVLYSYNGSTPQPYYYHRNLQGDVIAIYDANGNRKVEYAYDAFGNCTVKYASMSDLANSNPIRYRGYYYDRETGLYYLNARYYNPEWRRFISPDSPSALDPKSVNGLNLYAYCKNNPVAGNTLFNLNSNHIKYNINILPQINTQPSNTSKGNDNYWNPHWKNDWFDTDKPGFFVLSSSAFAVVDWGLTLYKGSLYFDNNEHHSVYNASINISMYAGVDFEELKFGVEFGGSIGQIGYDGIFIDVYIDFLTAKFFCIYKNGKLKIDPGFGFVDFGVSIDIEAIIKLLKGDIVL
jgi:RHS repeat-associated protein